jgi:NADPH:quinone reductase-like Zn-dependent oxidoreductase
LKQYRLIRSGHEGPFTLKLTDVAVREPGAHEVLVKVRAASLNRRDVYVAHGVYPLGPRESLIPLSDGAGEVVAIGAGVSRLQTGDRVAAIFFQDWIGGRSTPQGLASAIGGQRDGMLSEYVTLPEHGLVKLPESVSFEEGATLPCAALTAWNALFNRGRLQSGDFVLLEGTGGVSIFGVQFAAAAGGKPIITSSSDEKLKRARALGAIGGVNYQAVVDWEKPVRELTGGVGVHHVLEVGGKDSIAHSLATLATGAHVALIGGLGGFGGELPVLTLLDQNAVASGIFVGSREDFEAMNAFIDRHRIKPVIDRVFEFEDAQAAFALMESNAFFGKIVIRI